MTDHARMPGDSMNPPASRPLSPPTATPGSLPAPVTTVQITNDFALEAAQEAIASCQAQGRVVGVAITDAAGVLQLGMSAEGAAPPGRIVASIYKAVAALAFGKATLMVRDELDADLSRAGGLRPNVVIFAGGVPIMAKGRIVGTIGISGASTLEDEGCARSGLP